MTETLVAASLPFHVERIQTDNGSEFQAAFHWHVLDRGIQHVYIRPATPHLNGKVERSHRIDAEEFYRMLDGVVVDDAKVFSLKLQEWRTSAISIARTVRSAGRPPTSVCVRRSAPPTSLAYVSRTVAPE